MKYIVSLIVVGLVLVASGVSADTIEVSKETIAILKDKGIDSIPAYLDNIADGYEKNRLEKKWNKKTIAEKKELLNGE